MTTQRALGNGNRTVVNERSSNSWSDWQIGLKPRCDSCVVAMCTVISQTTELYFAKQAHKTFINSRAVLLEDVSIEISCCEVTLDDD